MDRIGVVIERFEKRYLKAHWKVAAMSSDDIPTVYHFPPDVFNVLADLLPRLNKSKRGLLTFFRSAGVPLAIYEDLEAALRSDRQAHTKHDIAHTVLSRLNEQGDNMLAARRETIKRAVQFDSYEACWENDRLVARGLVAQLRELVHAKDTFTRLKDAHDIAIEKVRAQGEQERRIRAEKQIEREGIKKDLYGLFGETDPYKRAKELERILSRVFQHFGILIREPFHLVMNGNIVEQIDGAIEIDGRFYLVELKWYKEPLGKEHAATHLVRVYQRNDANGLLISASGFAPAVIEDHRLALTQRTTIMADLEEIVRMLEGTGDLVVLLRRKVAAAITDKNPYLRILG